MNAPLFAMLNGWEIVALLVLALVLFGAKKLPELAKGLGHGIKEFKKASREVTDEFQNVMDDSPPPPPAPQKKLPESKPDEVAETVPPSESETSKD